MHPPPGSRVVEICGRVWRELHPDGAFSGYSLECQYHAGCVRDCGFGKKLNMTQVECRRRLLAWEESGAALTGTLAEQIKSHRKLGVGRLLADFAEQGRPCTLHPSSLFWHWETLIMLMAGSAAVCQLLAHVF